MSYYTPWWRDNRIFVWVGATVNLSICHDTKWISCRCTCPRFGSNQVGYISYPFDMYNTVVRSILYTTEAVNKLDIGVTQHLFSLFMSSSTSSLFVSTRKKYNFHSYTELFKMPFGTCDPACCTKWPLSIINNPIELLNCFDYYIREQIASFHVIITTVMVQWGTKSWWVHWHNLTSALSHSFSCYDTS